MVRTPRYVTLVLTFIANSRAFIIASFHFFYILKVHYQFNLACNASASVQYCGYVI